ncbi:MAG: ThiF family adenylyltransferase [Succinivibrio sp.]
MTFDTKLAFRGIRALYGTSGFEKLQNSHVTVIGVGGIGSWCTEALCRTGIGSLTLIDNDVIEITNLNRQLHTTSLTPGKLKAQVLADRLKEINPLIKIEVLSTKLTPENIDSTLSGKDKYVCECIDDIEAKAYIANYLYHHESTFIVAGGAGGRIDPSHLKIADLAQANGDALISKLRSKLRKEYGFSSNSKKLKITCTFSDEKPIYSSKEEYLSGDLPAFGASMSVTASAGLLISSWMVNQIIQK